MRTLLIVIIAFFACDAYAQQQFFIKQQVVGGETGILDSYTGAEVAYSVNKLLYSGFSVTDDNSSSATFNESNSFTVRVRRSNDDAVRSFTHTEITDGTLTTWVGANDAYVEKHYTQSGSNHAENSTLLEQPQIVESGTLVDDPLLYNSDNGKTELVLNSSIASSTHSTFIVFKRSSNSNAVILANTNSYTDVLFINDSNIRYKSGGTNYTLSSGVSFSAGTTYLLSIIRTSTSASFYIDGSLAGTITVANDFTFDRIGTAATLSVEDNIKLLVQYNSDQSASRSAIESAINSAYSVY